MRWLILALLALGIGLGCNKATDQPAKQPETGKLKGADAVLQPSPPPPLPGGQ